GIRHRIRSVLAVAVCAVLAGCRSFTAVGEWTANASDQGLEALKVDRCPPSESTIDARCNGWMATSGTPLSAEKSWRLRVRRRNGTSRLDARQSTIAATRWRRQAAP